MEDQKYSEFLKMLEAELLSYRWGCIFDTEKKIPVAEFGNPPTNADGSLATQCNAVFNEALKTEGKCVEVMTQDDQWILLMRRFLHSPLLCFVLLRSGGITTGWARDTVKQKIEQFVQ